ncbi:MAG TPA: twin-arginine translocase TatA/TatE family subunit [Dehalococcoidia bacterium]|jgi:sec-independent protein translocase protein TatA|nr:twin-arginine translocase TatA/TatE family subunit [Dehalococcoidia bacterium]
MTDLFANPLHLTLLIIVIVLLFGASKLGDVGGALGKSIREFKKEASSGDEPKVTTPPATGGYVPPATQSFSQQPPVAPPQNGYVAPAPPPVYSAPAAPSSYTPPAPPASYTPGDYRPSGQTQTPPPAAPPAAPPEYRGR